MENSCLPSPYLLLRLLDGSQKKFVLDPGKTWTLGRDPDNSIVIPDTSVSRQHAILQCLDSNSLYLIDLGSSNGSFVNQLRVSIPTLLKNRDLLTLGQSEIEFYSGEDSSESSDPANQLAKGDATHILHVRRLISVLVVDIRGFTQLTQSLDEQLLSRVIGEWFQRAGEITRRNGSRVDKYIGDAVMAVWFHSRDPATDPKSSDTDSSWIKMVSILKALQELFEMTESVSKLFTLASPIQIGAGISTGHAIVGQMGSGERQEYTVLGDTVNAAFRLESSTRLLNTDIVISQDTHQFLRQTDPTCFQATEILLKGYNTPHTVYYTNFPNFQHFMRHQHSA